MRAGTLVRNPTIDAATSEGRVNIRGLSDETHAADMTEVLATESRTAFRTILRRIWDVESRSFFSGVFLVKLAVAGVVRRSPVIKV